MTVTRRSLIGSRPVLRDQWQVWRSGVTDADAALAAIYTSLPAGSIRMAAGDRLQFFAGGLGTSSPVIMSFDLYQLIPIFDPADAADADAQPAGWVPFRLAALVTADSAGGTVAPAGWATAFPGVVAENDLIFDTGVVTDQGGGATDWSTQAPIVHDCNARGGAQLFAHCVGATNLDYGWLLARRERGVATRTGSPP